MKFMHVIVKERKQNPFFLSDFYRFSDLWLNIIIKQTTIAICIDAKGREFQLAQAGNQGKGGNMYISFGKYTFSIENCKES